MVGVLLQCNGLLLQPDQTSEFAEVSEKFADQVTVSNNGEMSDTDSAFQEKRPFLFSFCTAWSTDAICRVVLLYSSRTVLQKELHVMFAHRSLPRSEKNAFTTGS